MDLLRLIATERDPQRRRDIDVLARRRQRPAWPLQGAGLRTLPGDLLHDGLAARNHVADGTAAIREGLLPPLAQLDISVHAIGTSLGPLIDNVRHQVCGKPLANPQR